MNIEKTSNPWKRIQIKRLPWLLLACLLCVASWRLQAQPNDAITLEGGQIEAGATKEFPIYFRDIPGNTIDNDQTCDFESFFLDLMVPAQFISQASFRPAGVIESIAQEFTDIFDPGQNSLQWFVHFNDAELRLGPPAPGDLVGMLSITAMGNAGGQTISFQPRPLTFAQSRAGCSTISVDNGLLDTFLGDINVGGGAVDPPNVASFAVQPSTITAGMAATLSWSVNGADTVSINQGIGVVAASGNMQVSPQNTTTYRLTATNAGGQDTAQVTLTVNPAAGEPNIVSFQALPASILQGESSTLSWQVADADQVTISGVGSVGASGSTMVSPQSTTNYQLTATNGSGTSQASVTVQVLEPMLPVINSFSADPERVVLGDPTTLSWNVSLPETLTLEDSSGNSWNLNGDNGSIDVTPEDTTFYTLRAANDFGQVDQSVIVAVAQIVRFTASSQSIFDGESVTLTWEVVNADEVSIDQEIGVVEDEDSLPLTLNQTTTFTLSATVGAQVLTAQVTVEVVQSAGIYFPLVRSSAAFQSEIVTVNLEQDTVEYELEIFDSAGSRVQGPISGQLNRYATLKVIPDLIPGGTGWARLKVPGLEQARLGGILNTRSTDGEELYSYSASPVGQEPIFVPHVAADPQFDTFGALVSTGTVKDRFWFDTQQDSFFIDSLDQNQQAVFDFRALMGGQVTGGGWGRLSSELEASPMVGTEVFSRVDQTQHQSVAVGLDGNLANTLIFPHLAKDTLTFWTGVVIINTGAATANLDFQIFDDAGLDVLTADLPATLLPGEKRAFLMDRNVKAFGEGASWLLVQSDQPLIGYMLFGTYPPEDDRFSGFQSVKQAANRLCFPYLDDSIAAGGLTGIALVNPGGATQIQLQLLNVDGQLKEQTQRSLGTKEKLVALVTNLFETTIEAGDKVIAQASQPIVAFEIFGRGTRTLGGVLAVAF